MLSSVTYNPTCSLSPVGSHIFSQKDDGADGLNICLSSHHKHNRYIIKSHFAQLELSKSFPVSLVRDKTMFRVLNRKYIQLELCFICFAVIESFSFGRIFGLFSLSM